MTPSKATTIHGFHTQFFQSQWDIMADDICSMVNVFKRGTLDPKLNKTLTGLIRKNKWA